MKRFGRSANAQITQDGAAGRHLKTGVCAAAPLRTCPTQSVYNGRFIGADTPRRVVATIAPQAGNRQAGAATVKRPAWLRTHFYFLHSLLICVIVVYGFSRTIDKNLIHPAVSRPPILYLHALIFSGWLVFLILQSVLVRTHNVNWHRRTGWYGVLHGTAIPLVGFPTAVVMARFHLHTLRDTDTVADLLIPFWDMVAFSIPFALAIYWRKRPEFHRRLILTATCALTAAAFGRFPPQILPPIAFYAGVDMLILLGALRDQIVNRRIHRVYAIGLPVLLLGQAAVMALVVGELPAWVKIARAILG